MPFDAWLAGPLKETISDALSETSIRKRGWFHFDEVQRMGIEYKDGKIPWVKPWLVMMIELWAREVLDK
jgi:hypothetical protein